MPKKLIALIVAAVLGVAFADPCTDCRMAPTPTPKTAPVCPAPAPTTP